MLVLIYIKVKIENRKKEYINMSLLLERKIRHNIKVYSCNIKHKPKWSG